MSLISKIEWIEGGKTIRFFSDNDHSFADISVADFQFGTLTYQKVQEFLLTLKGRTLLLDRLIDGLIRLGPHGLRELLR